MDKVQIREQLSALYPPWCKLTDNEKNELVEHSSVASYRKGATIHDGNIDCVGVLLIEKGKLRVYILSDEGKEITLYRLKANEICILSASCVVSSITFDVHIDAEVDTDVLVINSEFYASLREKNIYANCHCFELLTNRFSDVMWAMQQILFMSYDKRLAIFLWDEYAASGDETIHMTHEQVAKYTGSAREVVTRMLKYFAEDGIVELMRGGIKIIDKSKLRALLS
ncbi:MAG: Crp/Fnr family transcriptional regulator [Oscillospiraceae bacterium]